MLFTLFVAPIAPQDCASKPRLPLSTGAKNLPTLTSSADHQQRMQAAGKAAASYAADTTTAASALGAAAVTPQPRGLSGASCLPADEAPAQTGIVILQPPLPAYILFVVDGTWRQAKEMFTVGPVLNSMRACVCVCSWTGSCCGIDDQSSHPGEVVGLT